VIISFDPIIILSGKYAGRVVVLAIHRKASVSGIKGNVDEYL
jgi:hypothetical protein